MSGHRLRSIRKDQEVISHVIALTESLCVRPSQPTSPLAQTGSSFPGMKNERAAIFWRRCQGFDDILSLGRGP